jgi:formylmethanofuran dehydrogenase subunit D
MVLGDRDLLLDTDRKAVVMAAVDMTRLALREGDPIQLRNATGSLEGRAHAGPVHPGTVVLVWPEANDLIPRGDVDPVSGIPAYRGAAVEVIPLGKGRGVPAAAGAASRP